MRGGASAQVRRADVATYIGGQPASQPASLLREPSGPSGLVQLFVCDAWGLSAYRLAAFRLLSATLETRAFVTLRGLSALLGLLCWRRRLLGAVGRDFMGCAWLRVVSGFCDAEDTFGSASPRLTYSGLNNQTRD